MSSQIPDLSEFSDSILKESTLLYIEDDKDQKQEGLEIFRSVFKEVFSASDGTEGLNLYTQNKHKIDIILTDIIMPNMDGVSFMEEVRQSDWSIPILVTTELENLSVIPKVIKLKVSNFIFKPILFKTTLKIMNEILEQVNHLSLLEKRQHELDQFKDIIDNQSLVSETDLTGKIIYANDMFCEVSGYTKEELIGQSHNIVRHPDVSPKVFENLWETIQSGNVWFGKIKNKAKDGSPYHVKATIFPVFDCQGEIVKYMGSRNLITDEEQEKQKLKKYIMALRSEKIKNDKDNKAAIQQEVDKAVKEMRIKDFQKNEKITQAMNDIEQELYRLRSAKEHATKKVSALEKEIREKQIKTDNMQKAYQEKSEKLFEVAKIAYDKYEVVKKQNDEFEEKFQKAQEGIQTYQSYVDEYRKKIKNLEDVIKSLEKDIKELKEPSS